MKRGGVGESGEGGGTGQTRYEGKNKRDVMQTEEVMILHS